MKGLKMLPQQVQAGVSHAWVLAPWVGLKYPSTQGWSVKAVFKNKLAGRTVNATWQGDGWKLVLAPTVLNPLATTEPMAVGWQMIATNNTTGDVWEVKQGRFSLLPALADTTTGQDVRTSNERILEAIRATIEKRASKLQERYTVDGVELQYTPLKDLLELERRYATLVANEDRQRRGLLPFQVVRTSLN